MRKIRARLTPLQLHAPRFADGRGQEARDAHRRRTLSATLPPIHLSRSQDSHAVQGAVQQEVYLR